LAVDYKVSVKLDLSLEFILEFHRKAPTCDAFHYVITGVRTGM